MTMPFPTLLPRSPSALQVAVAKVATTAPNTSRPMPTTAFTKAPIQFPGLGTAAGPVAVSSTSLPASVTAPNSSTAGNQLAKLARFAAPSLPPSVLRAAATLAPINAQSLLQTPVATAPTAAAVPTSSGSVQFGPGGPASMPPVTGSVQPPPAPAASDWPSTSPPSNTLTMPDPSFPGNGAGDDVGATGVDLSAPASSGSMSIGGPYVPLLIAGGAALGLWMLFGGE